MTRKANQAVSNGWRGAASGMRPGYESMRKTVEFGLERGYSVLLVAPGVDEKNMLDRLLIVMPDATHSGLKATARPADTQRAAAFASFDTHASTQHDERSAKGEKRRRS